MKTSVQILFRQEVGHLDEEHDDPNGVLVTLSYWETPDAYKLPSHYILHCKVMVDRELVVDTKQIVAEHGWQSHAMEIRRAISTMDQLILGHPSNNVKLLECVHEYAKNR